MGSPAVILLMLTLGGPKEPLRKGEVDELKSDWKHESEITRFDTRLVISQNKCVNVLTISCYKTIRCSWIIIKELFFLLFVSLDPFPCPSQSPLSGAICWMQEPGYESLAVQKSQDYRSRRSKIELCKCIGPHFEQKPVRIVWNSSCVRFIGEEAVLP